MASQTHSTGSATPAPVASPSTSVNGSAIPAIGSNAPAVASATPAIASATPEAPRQRPGRQGRKKQIEEDAMILQGRIPDEELARPQKRKRGRKADLILHGKPTSNVLGRPRKTAATGTENAVAPSQSAWTAAAAKAKAEAKAKPAATRDFLVPAQSIEHDEDSDNDNGGNNNANAHVDKARTGNNNHHDSDDDALFVPSDTRESTTIEVAPHASTPHGPSERREATPHPHTSRRRVRYPTPRAATPSGFQPDRQLASEQTPFHQLYFPHSLILQLKANMHAWNDRVGHSENIVFVLVHQIDDEVTEIRVYTSPNDANGHVMKLMAEKHPEAFAVPKEVGANDEEGVKIKMEEPERAKSILQWMQNGATDEGALLPIRDQQGAIPMGMGPDPVFEYWGEWKFTANCLKMEARMRDGSRVKAFVSLKHLRKSRSD